MRWAAAIALGLVVAWLAYGRAARGQGARVLALALLRAAAVAIVAALLIGAPSAPARLASPLVALDVSASWRRAVGDDSTAVRALRTAASSASSGSDQLVFVGDSLREVSARDIARVLPNDGASRIRPAIDRAAALGRPLLLITDGEVDDADAIADAPAGSSVRVLPRAAKSDAAIAELGVPLSASAGDTIQAAMLVSAGSAGSAEGRVAVTLDDSIVGTVPVAALTAYSSTRVILPIVLPRGSRLGVVRAVLQVAGDVEARNDTLAASLEIADRTPAVFVSTAPDLDVREALVVLRGALQVPTKAYLRVAPGQWREEGTLVPVREDDVKQRATSAGMLIVHGDTAWATALKSTTRSARALWTPAPPTAVARAGENTRAAEWYATGAPVSPLAASLAGLPWDTLPPLTLAGPAKGQFTVLEAKLGKAGEATAAVAGRDVAGARTLVVSGSGYAGWSLRGGRSAEAFTALWGSMFDWLAAGRGDVRAARPVLAAVRAGEAIRWRRGGGDSLVSVVVRRRMPGASTAARVPGDTMRLRFSGSAFETVGPSLAAGVYDVATTGGASLLVVNASREWVPRGPTLRDGPGARGGQASDAPRLVDSWWSFLLALLLLCGEWVGRRMAGLR